MRCLEKRPGAALRVGAGAGGRPRAVPRTVTRWRRGGCRRATCCGARRGGIAGGSALAGAGLLAALVVAALWIRDRQQAARRAGAGARAGAGSREAGGLPAPRATGCRCTTSSGSASAVRKRLPAIEARMAAAGRRARVRGTTRSAGPTWRSRSRSRRACTSRRRPRRGTRPQTSITRWAWCWASCMIARWRRRGGSPIRRSRRRGRRRSRSSTPRPRAGTSRGRAGRGSRHPRTVEGLIELRAGRPEAALARAKVAQEQAPWLYEPRRLEGDARFALGNRYRPDAAFDYERMMSEYRAADRRVPRRGRDRAERSGGARGGVPALGPDHECVDGAAGTLPASYAAAAAACGRAAAATSRGTSPRIERAFVELQHAWLMTTGDGQTDPAPVIEAAAARAAEVLRLAPKEPMAHYLVGLAAIVRAQYQDHLGADSRADVGARDRRPRAGATPSIPPSSGP